MKPSAQIRFVPLLDRFPARRLVQRLLVTFLPLTIILCSGCAPSRPAQPKSQTLYQNPNPAPPQSRAKNIVVPSRETAIQIAKAIWAPIYGVKTVQAGQAFDAVLAGGIWTVTARFGSGAMVEGTAIIDIAQEDGRVSKIAHGQFQPGSEWR